MGTNSEKEVEAIRVASLRNSENVKIYILGATPSAAGPFWLLGIAIWEPRCFVFEVLGAISASGSISGGYFGTSGAPWGAILAPRDHPGGPWEQQDGLEFANNRILVDLGMIPGFVYVSFWGPKCIKNLFIFRLVSRSSF